MTQNVQAVPRISALIRGDSTGEITIDGVSQHVAAADEAGVREEIITRVTATALALGRAVRLLAEDEQGHTPLIVHPDGRVEDDGDFIPTPPSAENLRPASFVDDADDATEGSEPGSDADDSDDTDEPKASRFAPVSDFRAHLGLGINVGDADYDDDADDDSDDDDVDEALDLDILPMTVAMPVPKSVPFPASATPETPVEPYEPPAALSEPEGEVFPPNLANFLSSRPPLPVSPALQGWRGTIRRLSGGLISPAPGGIEVSHRAAIAAVQRPLNGPRTIVVLNPKGGAHKTTATLLIAATFGMHRGGYTLAWDNNETMGTLGVRVQAAHHTNTAVDLLRDLEDFAYSSTARVGDLDAYVRNQGEARFDALASDLDPAGAASIDDVAFGKLHAALSRFYRVVIIDTGNNMRASNWEAAVETADQLVVVSTIREDTGYGAASLLDGLRQKGHAEKVAQAVTILASPAKTADKQLSRRLHEHFDQLTRAVVDVPYDPALVSGGPLNIDALAPRTREAWLHATAAIAEGL
jgi:MinD-like ATPase involved in chromosome partitioning or flagellar assembly